MRWGQLAFIWGKSSEDSPVCDVNKEQRPRQFNCHRQKCLDGHGHELRPFAPARSSWSALREGAVGQGDKRTRSGPWKPESSCQCARLGADAQLGVPGTRWGPPPRPTAPECADLTLQSEWTPFCFLGVWELWAAFALSLSLLSLSLFISPTHSLLPYLSVFPLPSPYVYLSLSV